MKTKTALIILGVAIVVIAIIAMATPKKNVEENNEPQIDPETGEVILGTGGPDGSGADAVPSDSTESKAPANPAFPKTGFKPVK